VLPSFIVYGSVHVNRRLWRSKVRNGQCCVRLLFRDQSLFIEGCGEVK
jgi:hypothetical protein